jgi:hypothetical protein
MMLEVEVEVGTEMEIGIMRDKTKGIPWRA